ncbi:MAG: LptA/OstA family protein, partial [Candidatus Angelobacter sp.]
VYGKGNVKTTYNDLKSQPDGAMLGSSEPVHVTGTTFTASQGVGTARYTAARLWQGANIVEAPSLTFDKIHRSLQGKGDQSGRVISVFLESDKNGKSTPLSVTADRLSYVDAERRAVFSGNVLIRSAGAIMNADTVQVQLLARNGTAGSQLERIVAEGDIRIEQGDRRATGARLIYTAQEQKFVLRGSTGNPPSIFDAEHGRISGDSLTFYTHGDRVLVGSGDSAKKLTPTRIRDASKK